MPPTIDDKDEGRLRARLALSGQGEVAEWKQTEEYFERRKKEAAKALSSEEQKKEQAKEEKARLDKINSQEKLAELEAKRKLEEEEKNKNLAAIQKEKDEAAEKLRQERIKEIIESRRTIQTIREREEPGLSPIQTLTRDVGQAIESGNLTAAKIASINTEKKLAAKKEQFNLKKTLIIILGLALIISSSFFLAYSLWKKAKENQVIVQENHDSIIFADDHIKIDLTDQSSEIITTALKSELTVPSGRERIKDVYFIYTDKRQTEEGLILEKKIADFSIVSSSTGLSINPDFLRFLEPDFMLGIYSNGQVAPFFIFRTEVYGNVADILIHNEGEMISRFMSPFYENSEVQRIKNTPFVDKMIKNYNLRLAIDANNQTLALYTWLDKSTLLIAPNEFIFEKILNSYLTPKPVIK